VRNWRSAKVKNIGGNSHECEKAESVELFHGTSDGDSRGF